MPDARALIDSLAAHLAEVLGAMTGSAVKALPAVGPATLAWEIAVQVNGPMAGTLWLGLTAEGAQRITSTILGDPDNVPDVDIIDALRELVSQAAGAYVHSSAGRGLTLDVSGPIAARASLPPDAQHLDLMLGTDVPSRLVGWSSLALPSAPLASHAAPPPSPSAAAPGAPPRNLDVVLDIELPITVRFGETQMTLESLSRLGPGSMIDLERAPDDPVDVLVNGRLVARGQVVVVSGCYGVRVSEVVSPADRLRSLEV